MEEYIWRRILCSACNKTDGTLWGIGRGQGTGELAQNNVVNYSSPVQIPGTTWVTVEGGYSCHATKTDGTLWTWGINSQGGLGNSSLTSLSSPVQIPGTDWWTTLPPRSSRGPVYAYKQA